MTEEAPGIVLLQPGDLSVGPRPLFQDGDQPAVEVERPHFWFLYVSLLSGQYRLLMGQNQRGLCPI